MKMVGPARCAAWLRSAPRMWMWWVAMRLSRVVSMAVLVSTFLAGSLWKWALPMVRCGGCSWRVVGMRRCPR